MKVQASLLASAHFMYLGQVFKHQDRCRHTWFLSPCPQHGQFCTHSSKTSNKHINMRHLGTDTVECILSSGIYLHFNMQGGFTVLFSLQIWKLNLKEKKQAQQTNKPKKKNLPQILLPRYSFPLIKKKRLSRVSQFLISMNVPTKESKNSNFSPTKFYF